MWRLLEILFKPLGWAQDFYYFCKRNKTEVLAIFVVLVVVILFGTGIGAMLQDKYTSGTVPPIADKVIKEKLHSSNVVSVLLSCGIYISITIITFVPWLPLVYDKSVEWQRIRTRHILLTYLMFSWAGAVTVFIIWKLVDHGLIT